MTIEDAEKLTIPKYIAERIRKADLKEHTTPDKHLRFYAYLALWKRKELIKITVAAKHYRKKLYMKIVAIHAVLLFALSNNSLYLFALSPSEVL